jgi:uncharacterized repeat protein (TIGR01451 family)
MSDRKFLFLATVIIGIGHFASLNASAQPLKASPTPAVKPHATGRGYRSFESLVFEQNLGQADSAFPFLLRSAHSAVGFGRQGLSAMVLGYPPDKGRDPAARMPGNAIRLTFAKAAAAQVLGRDALKGWVNIVKGRDRSRWRSHVPAFGALEYRGLYPGIRMFADAKTGRLEYGFVLDAKADVKTIEIAVEGLKTLEIDGHGDLVMLTDGGPIRQTRPRFREEASGVERELKGRFVLTGATRYGFEVEGRSAGATLTIDPEIVFASYFGGSGKEGLLNSDIDERGGGDVIGLGFDIALAPGDANPDVANDVFVAGSTASVDFPATMGSFLGLSDAFAMRFDPTAAPGAQLKYATFIGGSSGSGPITRGSGIAPLGDGRAYVTGVSFATDFPTSMGVVQVDHQSSAGTLVRLKPDGTFDIGTFVGGKRSHVPRSVVFNKRANESGFVYIAGFSAIRSGSGTEEDTLPNAAQPSFGGGLLDGFVAKLDLELTQYRYFTFLGGSGRDAVLDLAVEDGLAFVTGSTTSIDIPSPDGPVVPHAQATTGVNCTADNMGNIDNMPLKCFDAFVAKLNRNGTSLGYLTYLGAMPYTTPFAGAETDMERFGRGIAVTHDSSPRAFVTGGARSTKAGSTSSEIFVARFDSGGAVDWYTPESAQVPDHGEGIAVDPAGLVHVTGTVSVPNLATGIPSGSADPVTESFHGATDAFYARLNGATGHLDSFAYLGGSGEDNGVAIARGSQSACTAIAASTTSSDVRTVPSGERPNGGADLFLWALCDRTGTLPGFTKSVAPNPATLGGPLTYTITVSNGGDAAIPIRVTDVVPDDVIVTGVSSSSTIQCGRNGSSVSCPAGSGTTSASQGTSTITITALTARCAVAPQNTATLEVFDASGQRLSTQSALAIGVIGCPDPQCANGGNCPPGGCGDGIKDPTEACDEGSRNGTPGSTCTSQCKLAEKAACRTTPTLCDTGLVCGKNCSGHSDCWNVPSPVPFLPSFVYCADSGDPLCDADYSCMPANRATLTLP